MAKSIKSLEEVKIPKTYELVNGEYVKEVDSFMLTLKHKLSGARVLIFSNEDDNKVFDIAFRTPPKDATGVPHIIEHTVLCGSEKYPAKDPFVELVKGSLNTYLNATTYPDKTMYPVASYNDKDFANLMSVYMDAVFYPNIYKHEEIFKQEGWHYELESKDAPITYNGVVYNEMKGAYSSEESVLERFTMNSLFPDNTYAHESGGDPKNIPDLTYEDYLDFHRKYYHPVNSYICIYGDVDIEERLNWMDENYLKNFPAIIVDSHIELQKPFDRMKTLSTEYAVATDADCSEKTYYSFCTAMDITLDQEKCKAFELISYVLLEMPGAPLKQAILDAGIGTDIDVDFCDILRQSMFSITTKNAKPGLREKFYEVIISKLKEIVAEGINRKDLEAAINGTEFREREADFGGFPKGLLYVLKTFKTWLYDDSKPYDGLVYEDVYKSLREKLETDYYEKLIDEYILNNPHAVLVDMNPKPGLAIENEKALEKKLAEYKASLSDEQIDELVEQTKALKAYQEEPSPKEILEKIPLLKREDIGKNVRPVHNEEKELCGIKTVHHNVHTNGIIYLDMMFDVDSLSEYVPQMSFLATLLGYMDTTEHTYREFDTETNFYSGGIGSDLNIYSIYDTDEVKLKFTVRTKTLAGRIKDTTKLMAEMMFKTLFTDEKHLREVVAETRSRLKVRLMSAGHQAAVSYSMAGLTLDGWYNDYSMGIGYYDYLVKLDENFDSEKEKLIKGCEELVKAMFKKEKMLISCTCDENDYGLLGGAISEFDSELENFEKENSADILGLECYKPDVKYRKTAFSTPAEVQYAAVSGSYKEVPDVNDGAMMVVKHLLSYGYLWNEVRVKGGAYGVMCRFSRAGSGSFVSYRDPNLSATYDVYKKAADFLENYDADEREVTKTIIGTISGLDTPLTPSMDGKRSMSMYLTKTPLEVIQKERNQVLACTKEDIRNTADAVRKIANTENICVIGNEKRIKDEASLFESIKPLS